VCFSCDPGFRGTPAQGRRERERKPVSINDKGGDAGIVKIAKIAGILNLKHSLGSIPRLPDFGNYQLFDESHRLHARDFKAFAAAHVFAHHHIVAADHIGAGLGEFGAVALIGPSGKLFLLGADEPRQLILIRLPAVGTIEGMGLFGVFLVVKIALIHAYYDKHSQAQPQPKPFSPQRAQRKNERDAFFNAPTA